MCLYWGHSSSTSLEIDEESNRKPHKRRVCCQKSYVSHTNSSIYFFLYLNLYSFLVSHKAPIILQRATKRAHSRKAYQCIWINYIIFAQKYYNSNFVNVGCLYTCVCLKFPLCLMIWFSTSCDVTRNSHICLLFFHSKVS